MKRLRLKTYLVVLPIVVATVVVSGFIGFQESRASLTRLANRHMAYKAEQLRDFINSEWDVVQSLGLGGEPQYRRAQEDSFRSYAYSLLRDESEEILVIDAAGDVAFRLGGAAGADGVADAAPKADAGDDGIPALPDGWFSARLGGQSRVGIAFRFGPFGWTVAISEPESYFFSDVDALLRTYAVILAGSLAAATLLCAVYLRRVTGPLERLSDAVARIGATGDLALRVPVEYDDEIGALALRFNVMLAALDEKSGRLAEAVAAERAAHDTAVQRETETLFLLARISDYNDEKTGAHLERIGALSALMVRLLGLGDDAEALIRASAPLHDIGKIGVSESVLLKPGRLTPAETEAMRLHAAMGYDILKGCHSRYLAEGATIALTHHERWDGSGYPQGLSGEAIPLSGRIVAVMDVFDALVSDRPYKDTWSKGAALDYIADQRGRHFDPALSDLFAHNFPEFSKAWDGLRGR